MVSEVKTDIFSLSPYLVVQEYNLITSAIINENIVYHCFISLFVSYKFDFIRFRLFSNSQLHLALQIVPQIYNTVFLTIFL